MFRVDIVINFLDMSEANRKKNIDTLVPDLEEMNFEGPNLLPLEEEDLEEEAVSAL